MYLIFYAIFLVALIYLSVMVWKRKNKIFGDSVEPESAEKRYKTLKVFLMVGGISLVVGIIGAIVHNVLYGLSEIEEPASFIIGFMALFIFIIATTGGVVIFIAGQRKTIKGGQDA